MKKKSKYLLMFVGAFITMMCGIQNVFAATLTMDFTGYYYERSDNGNNYSSWKLQNYTVDGNVAFCIEPGVPEGTNEYIQGSWENTGLPNSIKQRVLLLSYYGYQYSGHQTQEYRAATQALIWETILGGNTKVTYSTARYGQGTPYDVSYQKSVIENLVAHHYDRPSFNGTTVTTQVGTPITLTDTNNVLSNYEVYASNGADVSINGNKLTITPKQVGEITLQFSKKQIYSRSYLIYYANNYQNMISNENVSYFSLEKDEDGNYLVNGQKVLIPFIYKSTDNMMIQMLKQLDAPYSDEKGNILIFNDETRKILNDIAGLTKEGAFSTFKISSYPANFLNAGQCIFAIDSTAGSTWMGADAPLIYIAPENIV